MLSVFQFALGANPGGTSCNGLHAEAPPERGTAFSLRYMKGLGFHWFKYLKQERNLPLQSVKGPKRAQY